MIAPRTRLILLAGLVTLPGALWLALEPGAGTAVLAVGGIALLIVLADAARGVTGLDGISASFAGIARLTQAQKGEIYLELKNKSQQAKGIRLGLSLPEGIESAAEVMAIALPAGSELSHLSWPVVARRRGSYGLENVYLETDSPLGLWAVRKTSAARAEVRAYPNLLREKKNLAALFLNQGLLGVQAMRQVGKGREFEKLREYLAGDSYQDIHWKTTAKRGRPISKVYQLERTQEVYVVIDASRLSGRSVAAAAEEMGGEAAVTAQLERFITAALVLALVAEKQGDLFGLVIFDNQVRRFLRAGSGQAHFNAIRDALYTLETARVNPDFNELSAFTRLRLRRRALLIMLTNLDDPVLAENFVANLDLISRHHLLLVNMLTAPGVAPLFKGPEVHDLDDLYLRLSGHLQWQKLRELAKVLQSRGVNMAILDNALMCPQLVTQYINVKRRQLL